MSSAEEILVLGVHLESALGGHEKGCLRNSKPKAP